MLELLAIATILSALAASVTARPVPDRRVIVIGLGTHSRKQIDWMFTWHVPEDIIREIAEGRADEYDMTSWPERGDALDHITKDTRAVVAFHLYGIHTEDIDPADQHAAGFYYNQRNHQLLTLTQSLGVPLYVFGDQPRGDVPYRAYTRERTQCDDIATRLLDRWKEADPQGYGLEEDDLKWIVRDLGLKFLGAGAGRVVVAVGDDALKVGDPTANRTEMQVWRNAPPDIRQHLVPALDIAENGQWLRVERVRPGKGRSVDRATYERLVDYGIRDVTDDNTAADGRLLDYGMVAPSLRPPKR